MPPQSNGMGTFWIMMILTIIPAIVAIIIILLVRKANKKSNVVIDNKTIIGCDQNIPINQIAQIQQPIIAKYGDPAITLHTSDWHSIMVFPGYRIITIDRQEYFFKDIVSCKLVQSVDNTHDYTLFVLIRDFKQPIVEIPIGNDIRIAIEIEALFNLAIDKNQRLAENKSKSSNHQD